MNSELIPDNLRTIRGAAHISKLLWCSPSNIRLDPKLALAYYNRDVAYVNLNQHQRAIQDLNEAIRLYPEDAQA